MVQDTERTLIWVLPVSALVYARGFSRVHVQMPQRYPVWRLASFTAGLLVVLLALASPLDALGELLLHVHMTQHMLLIMVAPPLIWLGQPFVPLLRGLSPRLAKRVLGPLLTSRAVRSAGRALTHASVGWLALSAALLVWHVPQFYELGLHSEGWHEVSARRPLHGCAVVLVARDRRVAIPVRSAAVLRRRTADPVVDRVRGVRPARRAARVDPTVALRCQEARWAGLKTALPSSCLPGYLFLARHLLADCR